MSIKLLSNSDFHAVRLKAGEIRISAGIARWWMLPFWEAVPAGAPAVGTDGKRAKIIFHWRVGPFAIGAARSVEP